MLVLQNGKEKKTVCWRKKMYNFYVKISILINEFNKIEKAYISVWYLDTVYRWKVFIAQGKR